MKIIASHVYLGPNIHVPRRAICLLLQVSLPAAGNIGEILAGAQARISRTLTEFDGPDSGCAESDPRQNANGESPPLVVALFVARLANALQREAGFRADLCSASSTADPDVCNLVYDYDDEIVGAEAGVAASRITAHFLEPSSAGVETRAVNPETAIKRFLGAAESVRPTINWRVLLDGIEKRDIPWSKYRPGTRLVRLGYGRYRRDISETITDRSSWFAMNTVRDKVSTLDMLSGLALPVPQYHRVQTAEEAVQAARMLPGPAVVKPRSLGKGQGVSVGVQGEREVREAFELAAAHRTGVILEQYLEGDDHRLLVVDGRLVSAVKRIPGHVRGDGVHSVAELVDLVNRDTRRGTGDKDAMIRLELDAEAVHLLQKHGYTIESVPAVDELVFLRGAANLSKGGSAFDVTDQVHPDNQEAAERAARGIGLDIAGLDFLTTDISRSYRETGGAIFEVNGCPGLRPHLTAEGATTDVVAPIIDMLFPPGQPSRIPIAAVTGTNGKTTTVNMVAYILGQAGMRAAHATTAGAYIDGRQIMDGDRAGPRTARMLLSDRALEAAVFETARGGLLKGGLGFDGHAVGAVTNLSPDHLGFDGIETLDEMARVKRLVIETAREAAVLNADDERCLAMREYSGAKRLCLVSMRRDNPAIRELVDGGGCALWCEGDDSSADIVLHDHDTEHMRLRVDRIPATLGGRARHVIEDAMFAAGIALHMGVEPRVIEGALRSFQSSPELNPGRINVFEGASFRAIVDFGHNPAALAAMCRLIAETPVEGCRICVVTSPGNRRDEHFENIGRVMAGAFDHYVLCSRDDPRGRDPENVPGLIRQGLLSHGVGDEAVSIVPQEARAVETALAMLEPGDLLAVFCEKVNRAWHLISSFEQDGGVGGQA